MTRLYYCRDCGHRFESTEKEEMCFDCCSENLMHEATFDGEYVF